MIIKEKPFDSFDSILLTLTRELPVGRPFPVSVDPRRRPRNEVVGYPTSVLTTTFFHPDVDTSSIL